VNRSVRAAAPSVRFACQWDGLNPSVSFADSSPSRGALGKKDEPYAMPKAPLLAGAVAAGDWGVQPQTANNPLYHGLAQGVCFAVLFQPECNFTPR